MYDVLILVDNDGARYTRDINLCFAASGEWRNVIMTVVVLPDEYNGTCRCDINDKYQVITARNVKMLLLSLASSSAIRAELIGPV